MSVLPITETPEPPPADDTVWPRLVFPAPSTDPALRDRCPETPYDVHERLRRAA